jgi:hypothetical protein
MISEQAFARFMACCSKRSHIDELNARFTQILRVSSTADALEAIQGSLQSYVPLPPSRFRVMTKNVRIENGARNFDAGSDMAHAMRSMVSSPFQFPSLSC